MKLIIKKCPKVPIIWYEVAKTGSSSMINFFYSKFKKVNTVQHQKINKHRCFKFAFVRNPWSRIVSTFEDKTKKVVSTKWEHSFYKKYNNYSFKDFVIEINKLDIESENCDNHIRLQVNQIDFNHLDFLGRFENLQQDFDKICLNFKNIKESKLPHKNKSSLEHYTKYYDNETHEIIAEKYARDIEYFGYKFRD
jgi:hypothetical protein|tara:strand:- start:2936 stop:3517 length:582 start_codon:yes stop_codon:yes gene_type:complete